MIIVLIGHRGSGKTNCLTRWRNIYESRHWTADFFDLDEQIATANEKSVTQIFSSEGEEKFRHLEKQKFFSLYDAAVENRKTTFIAVGAGFTFDLPEDVYTIWIQRDTDLKPRTFLNRPRLDSQVRPSDEYIARATVREIKFQKLADEKILFPEGHEEFGEKSLNFEERFLTGEAIQISGIIPLSPQLLANGAKLDFWLSRRSSWQGVRFELRTDLLSSEQMTRGLNSVRDALVSYRKPTDVPVSGDALTDWAIELGQPSFKVDILSLHERSENESLETALERLNQAGKKGELLKAAPEVRSFEELRIGFAWQQEDTSRRSFLPRSKNGEWRWFRLLMKDRQELNYICEGRSEVLDQPSLIEWVQYSNEQNKFAAVIGDPIEHSLTPAYQSEYFSQVGVPVLRIQINEATWSPQTIETLKEFGLKYAAVTSPLKSLAAKLVASSVPINTLYWSESQERWLGTNTDVGSVKALTREKEKSIVAVWGGGGVLPAVEAQFPDANFYSASTGKLKSGEDSTPEVVVWAVGRKNMITGVWPSPNWKPSKVIDLNYSEDSPGKEYAQLVGADYVSGLPMFLEQANRQRDFWSQCECQ